MIWCIFVVLFVFTLVTILPKRDETETDRQRQSQTDRQRQTDRETEVALIRSKIDNEIPSNEMINIQF